MTVPDTPLALATWRREIAELYAEIRSTHVAEEPAAWEHWRDRRDDLFAEHPESPLGPPARKRFEGLQYFDYDRDYRVEATVETETGDETITVEVADGVLQYRQIGTAQFTLRGRSCQLPLYWVTGYGGGLFVPFGDETNGKITFGGGRYLYDTIKGADLGASPGEALLLDFNYAYNPSCAYDDRWQCPLAPAESDLAIPVEAGEYAFESGASQAVDTATAERRSSARTISPAER
jgi:uncharacterized protein (DUF1684 family)